MSVKAAPQQIRNRAYQSAFSEVITELNKSGCLKEEIEMSENANEMILTFCKAFRKLTPEQKHRLPPLSKLMYIVHQNPVKISHMEPTTIESHLKQIRILSVHVGAVLASVLCNLDEMIESDLKKAFAET